MKFDYEDMWSRGHLLRLKDIGLVLNAWANELSMASLSTWGHGGLDEVGDVRHGWRQLVLIVRVGGNLGLSRSVH